MRKPQVLTILTIIILAVIAVVVVQGKKPGDQSEINFLKKYGLSELSVEEIVYKLDSTTSDPPGLGASITGVNLVLMDDSNEVRVPLPDDRFYLSFAPYITQTHPCGTHSLTGCQGELVNQNVQVVIMDSEGNEIVNSELATMANGFVGVWLPRNVDAILTVIYDGMVAQAPIQTFERSDTCLTTPLKLN